jgi:hypothetical protein
MRRRTQTYLCSLRRTRRLYDHIDHPPRGAGHIRADVDFDFQTLGIRVPAILASPWLRAGTSGPGGIDKTVYDHTSLLAFVCDRFQLDRGRLGQRVKQAAHFGDAPIWLAAARNDTPATLPVVQAPARTRALSEHETGLAANHRRLVQGLHAYLKGQDLEAAWNADFPPTRGARALGAPQRLQDMVAEITHALSQGALPLAGSLGTPTAQAPAARAWSSKNLDTCTGTRVTWPLSTSYWRS